MTSDNKPSSKVTILGALVADAASLGFHWLYDQQRIEQRADNTPEFHTITQDDYLDVPSYFAHGRKSSGDLSHYGEQCLSLVMSLVDNHGQYNQDHYQTVFKNHFGYGGDYVGYIDRPTRDTLDAITAAERTALKHAEAIPFTGTNDEKQSLISLVSDLVKQHKALADAEITKQQIAYAQQLFQTLQVLADYHGADDEQLPAISKLPALAATYAGKPELLKHTESAVRVTNNNDNAVAYGHIASKMIEAAILTQDIADVIEAGRQAATPEILALIDTALAMSDKTTMEVTKQLGMSCELKFGLPSVFHNLSQQHSYADSIRHNIYAGGDSCGRAILLGAVLGNIHSIGGDKGIPHAWVDKLNQKQAIEALADQLS